MMGTAAFCFGMPALCSRQPSEVSVFELITAHGCQRNKAELIMNSE